MPTEVELLIKAFASNPIYHLNATTFIAINSSAYVYLDRMDDYRATEGTDTDTQTTSTSGFQVIPKLESLLEIAASNDMRYGLLLGIAAAKKIRFKDSKSMVAFINTRLDKYQLRDRANSEPSLWQKLLRDADKGHAPRERVEASHRRMQNDWGNSYRREHWREPNVQMSQKCAQRLSTLSIACRKKGLSYEDLMAIVRTSVFMRLQDSNLDTRCDIKVQAHDLKIAIKMVESGQSTRLTPEAAASNGYGVNADGFLCLAGSDASKRLVWVSEYEDTTSDAGSRKQDEEDMTEVTDTMPPTLENVSIKLDDDGVALINYNRPKNANALSYGTMKDLLTAFTWAHDHYKLDLIDVPAEGPLIPDASIEALNAIHSLFINSTKPLIAAVNGPAVGWASTSIALFDLVYSVPDAIFMTPFVKLGIVAEACSTVTFQRALGRQKASALILAGEQLTAEELERAGLITKILPKEGFLDAVLAIARRLAKQPPLSVAENKRLLLEPIRGELIAAAAREIEALKRRGRTDEPRAALKRFEEEQAAKKRKPKL
ncbi:hypothetical protein DV738_g60, partial [Chaetothyriales sp. CBS 135597]